jgi:cytochrome P450
MAGIVHCSVTPVPVSEAVLPAARSTNIWDGRSYRSKGISMGDRTVIEYEQLDEEFVQNPQRLYSRLREEGRAVHPVRMPWGLEMWLVTGYDAVREAFLDPRISKDTHQVSGLIQQHSLDKSHRGIDPRITSHMINTDPPGHERLRRLVGKAFTMRRVEEMRPRIAEITTELLDKMADQTEIDLLSRFAIPLPMTVICELLGVPVEAQTNFRKLTYVILSTTGGEDFADANTAMVEYLSDLVADCRAHPADTMLSALIQARDDGDRLSETELTSMCWLILFAGNDTTANLIGNGMLALMRHPDQYAELRRDRSLLPNAIEEFLRYEGPANMSTYRFSAAAVELGGVLIPEGEIVMIAPHASNHDPAVFPDPDQFAIHRQTKGHMGFGFGIHHCLGAQLARIEAGIAFTGLLDRFERIELAVPPENLRWRQHYFERALVQLPVRLHRTDPAR